MNDLSWSLDKQRFVIFSYSDISPGTFYLFDRKSKKLEWLADRAPWIDPKKMAHMEPVRYAAPVPGFLEGARAIANKIGAELVFDEVTAAFRTNVASLVTSMWLTKNPTWLP